MKYIKKIKCFKTMCWKKKNFGQLHGKIITFSVSSPTSNKNLTYLFSTLSWICGSEMTRPLWNGHEKYK